MKRIISILSIIVISMLIIPLFTVYTVRADAGMLVTLFLFFVLNPIISIWTGFLAGNEKKLWFTPVLVAGLFWIFSSFTYKTAFPVVYSAVYFLICSISMVSTMLAGKWKK